MKSKIILPYNFFRFCEKDLKKMQLDARTIIFICKELTIKIHLALELLTLICYLERCVFLVYLPIEFWSTLSYQIRSFSVYSYWMYINWWVWAFFQCCMIKFIYLKLYLYCEFIFWKIWGVALTFIYNKYIKMKLLISRTLILTQLWIWIRFPILNF